MSDGLSGHLGSASGSIQITTDKSQAAIKQLQGAIAQFGNTGSDSLNKLAAGLALLGTSKKIADVFVGAASSAIDFEAQLSAISAVSGATTVEMEKLRASALAVGQDTVFSASAAAQGLEELLKNGFSAAEAMDAIAGSAALAAAAGEDLGSAAGQISVSIKQFSLSAKDATRVADLFAAAASASAADAVDIAEAMKFVGATAAAMGIEIEDATTALAILADNGLKGSIAGTALNAMLTSLINPSREAADEITRLGISIKDSAGNIDTLPNILANVERATRNLTEAERLRVLNQIFGEQGGRAALNLLKSESKAAEATGQSWEDYSEKVRTAGAAGDQAAARLDNTKGSIEALRGSIDTSSIVIGSALTPALRGVIDAMTDVVNGFLSLDGPLQAVIGGFVGSIGVVTGFAGAMTILGPATSAFIKNLGLIRAALVTLTTSLGPIGLALAAIGAGIAIYELTKRSSDQEAQTKKLTEATDAYTTSLGDNTTALVKAGAFDITTGTRDFLDLWIKNGRTAQERIDAVNEAIATTADFGFDVSGLNEALGDIDQSQKDFIRDILERNGALEDGTITVDELTASLVELRAGFEITADEATRITDALTALTPKIQDPQFVGADIAKMADKIVADIVAGRVSIDDGIAQLQALATGGLGLDTFGLDQYNIALLLADKATKNATDTTKGWFATQVKAAAATSENARILKEWGRSLQGTSGHLADTTAYMEAQAVAAEKLKGQINSIKETFATLDLGDFDLNAIAQATGNTTLEISIDTTQAAAQLDNIYRVAVTNLDNIGRTVSGVQDWADALVGVEGEVGQIDQLLADGLITQARYDQAQRAYNRLTADNKDIQESILAIQAKQVPVLAKGVDLLDDQLNKIEGMEGIAQTAALGFLDAGESAKYLALQTQLAAAAAGDLGDEGKASLQAIVEGAVAADPYLSAMLQQMGLIKVGADGSITIDWDSVTAADSATNQLLDKMTTLVTLLADIFDIDIDDDDVTTATNHVDFLKNALTDLPDSKAVKVDVTVDGPNGGIAAGIGNLIGDWGNIQLTSQDLPVDADGLDAARTTLDTWGTLDLPPQALPVVTTGAAPTDNQKSPDFPTSAPPAIVIPAPDVSAYTDGLDQLETDTSGSMGTIIDSIKTILGPAKSTSQEAGTAFNQNLGTGMTDAVSTMQRSVTLIEQIANSTIPALRTAGANAGGAFDGALASELFHAVGDAANAAGAIRNAVANAMASMGNIGYGAGQAFGFGVANGIYSTIGAAASAANAMANAIRNASGGGFNPIGPRSFATASLLGSQPSAASSFVAAGRVSNTSVTITPHIAVSTTGEVGTQQLKQIETHINTSLFRAIDLAASAGVFGS